MSLLKEENKNEHPTNQNKISTTERYVTPGVYTNVINTAMELGLFDALAEEPMDARRLAAKLGTVENLTETFANILVALKLLEKSGDDYSLAPMAAEFLVKTSPVYQGGMIAMSLNFRVPYFVYMEGTFRRHPQED